MVVFNVNTILDYIRLNICLRLGLISQMMNQGYLVTIHILRIQYTCDMDNTISVSTTVYVVTTQ